MKETVVYESGPDAWTACGGYLVRRKRTSGWKVVSRVEQLAST